MREREIGAGYAQMLRQGRDGDFVAHELAKQAAWMGRIEHLHRDSLSAGH
jgi:predicted RNA binding protein with dsRBD fold (UPF0201 family)